MDKKVMEMAEILRAKRELQIVGQMNGVDAGDSRMTLYEYAREVCEHSQSGDSMAKCLPYLDRLGGRGVKVSAVTASWYEDFQERMRKDSGLKSAHTQEKYCCVVRQVLKKAVRDGLLPRDPSSGIKHIPVPDSKKEFLTVDEVRKMFSTPYARAGSMEPELQEDIRRAFIFGCLTGFRVSDLCLLTWADIDTERMEITRRQKKTRKLVVVPIKAETLEFILDGREIQASDPVFPYLAATHTTTNRYLKGWAHEAGIRKNVSWHTARHTAATLLLEYGAGIYTVMRILGHTKVQTTMQYAVVSDKKKRDAVDSIPEIGCQSESNVRFVQI
jgi:integrase